MEQRAWTALAVVDVDASAGFFVDVLGWSRSAGPVADTALVRDPAGDPVLLFGPFAGDVGAYLVPGAVVRSPGDTIRMPHPDLDTLLHHLSARGLAEPGIVVAPWGDRILDVPTPDGYTIRFVTRASLSPEEILLLYSTGPSALDAALQGLAEADLDLAPRPGSWTIRQLVHHIVDGDDLWAMAVKAALAASGSHYAHDWYSMDNACAGPLDYAGRDIGPALELFRASRLFTTALVRHVPDGWKRFVLFRPAGSAEPLHVNVGFMLTMQARHALEHIEEIQGIRRTYGR